MSKNPKQLSLKRLRITLFAAVAGLMISLGTSGARAAFSPASVSVIPPVQFPPGDFSVTGARVSALWGKHRDIYGIDIGILGNVTEQDFVGLGISGLFNLTRGQTTALGLQAAGIVNVNSNKTNVYGAQIALGLNVNHASASVTGLQLAALANISSFTEIRGAQVALYNTAKKVYGLQIGLVNVTDSLHGIQIGLLNFNHTGLFAVSPIINVGF